MTLGEATSRFLEYAGQNDSTVNAQLTSRARSLLLLNDYFSAHSELDHITPSKLRDFLARWYVERTCASKPNDSGAYDDIPEPRELIDSLAEFFKWAGREAGVDQARYSPILIELSRSLPRALAITFALTRALRERGGAFDFPEFLTSFEEGGSSQYDIDVPGGVGAIDGYFRLIRVEGLSAEAEELISEERLWPIVFPGEVAALLDAGFIINLELVRRREEWHIAGCGFAYPPGTEI